MTPAAAIAMLDRQLAKHGSSIALARVQTPGSQTTVKAHARDFRLDELAGSLRQDDTKVILSPTGLGAYGVPKRGDWITVRGRRRSVENVDIGTIDDVTVRYDLVVRG